jgi:hypothetical protein
MRTCLASLEELKNQTEEISGCVERGVLNASDADEWETLLALELDALLSDLRNGLVEATTVLRSMREKLHGPLATTMLTEAAENGGGTWYQGSAVPAPILLSNFLVTAMASASTEVGPFFATPRHAPIELPEHVLTMIALLLRERSPAAADAEARWLYAGLMGGIGSVCRSWRRLVKAVLMGDELAWLRVQGAAEAAECLSSFPHAKSLHIVGDAAAGEIVSALGSGSVARLAITNNNVVRGCKGLGRLVGLRALYITECRSLGRSLGWMTQLTSLNLRSTLRASAGSCAVSGCLRTPAMR